MKLKDNQAYVFVNTETGKYIKFNTDHLDEVEQPYEALIFKKAVVTRRLNRFPWLFKDPYRNERGYARYIHKREVKVVIVDLNYEVTNETT